MCNNLTIIIHYDGSGGGAKLSVRACVGVAGVVDIDLLDFHDSPWLSGLLGELHPTIFVCNVV